MRRRRKSGGALGNTFGAGSGGYLVVYGKHGCTLGDVPCGKAWAIRFRFTNTNPIPISMRTEHFRLL